jgi:hypothetical protein
MEFRVDCCDVCLNNGKSLVKIQRAAEIFGAFSPKDSGLEHLPGPMTPREPARKAHRLRNAMAYLVNPFLTGFVHGSSLSPMSMRVLLLAGWS